jgi:hypothetical protein
MRSLLVVGVLLTGCAVQGTRKPEAPTERLTEAATAPLVDLNLVRTKIPDVLNAARAQPYRLPGERGCAALAAEIALLDDALGPDLDVPKAQGDADLIERGTNEARNWAWDAIKGAAEGLLPYRGWVRKLTGAEQHSREVAAAIAAGIVRRAYLKGIGQALGCTPPAAPQIADRVDPPA